MRHLAAAGALFLVSASTAAGQQPTGRADLDSMAVLPQSHLVAARVAFSRTSANCPDDHGLLRMSGGWFRHHRVSVMRRQAPSAETFRAVDDFTYRYRVTTPECRIDLTVRQQVRRSDGSWHSLPVARMHRPNLSREERDAIIREYQRTAPPISAENAARYREAYRANASGSLNQGLAGTMSAPAVFEDAPAACIEGAGDFVADQDGITFSFLTGLPGELNRFAIERIDIDDENSRLNFTKADCRYEITIAASVLKDGQWLARPVAPYVPSTMRIIERRDPTSRPPWLDRQD